MDCNKDRSIMMEIKAENDMLKMFRGEYFISYHNFDICQICPDALNDFPHKSGRIFSPF